MHRVLLIDNYDSFTWNLVQALAAQGAEVLVHRNDQLTVEEAVALAPTHVVLSPGPGGPEQAGICAGVAEAFDGRVPLLGVCLGLQVLVSASGGTVAATTPVHGKASPVAHDGRGLFAGLPHPMAAGRYHSLVATEVPARFEVSARTADGLVMALRDREHPTVAVQFHPESILSPAGDQLLANFLAMKATLPLRCA